MTSRDQQALNTKNKLLESARKLIAQNGYYSVTIEDIVNDCQVAKGTFYHYFKSKEAIVFELSQSVYDILRAKCKAYESSPFEERLVLFITDWHQLMNAYNLHFARITLQMSGRLSLESNPEGRISHMEQGLALIQELFDSAVSNGELKADTPTEILSKALMFELQGSTIYHCNHGTEFDVMGWSKALTETIVLPLIAPYLTDPA